MLKAHSCSQICIYAELAIMSATGLARIKAKEKAIQKQILKIKRLKGFNQQVKRVTTNIKHITTVIKVQTGTKYSIPLKN